MVMLFLFRLFMANVINVNSQRVRTSDLYFLTTYEGINISDMSMDKWKVDENNDGPEKDIAEKIKEDGMINKSQDIMVTAFRFTAQKEVTDKDGTKHIIPRKGSDMIVHFTLSDKEMEKYDVSESGDGDLKSLIMQYTPQECSKKGRDKSLNGVVTIYNYNELMNTSGNYPDFNKYTVNDNGELDENGKITRTIFIDPFSNISSIYSDLGLEIDEEDSGSMTKTTNSDRDRAVSTARLDGKGFYIVLFATIEYTKRTKSGIKMGILPQIEAALFRDKNVTKDDFESRIVPIFLELSVRLYSFYSSRVLFNDFRKAFKALPCEIYKDLTKGMNEDEIKEKYFNGISENSNVYSMTEKLKKREEPKKSRKSKEEEAAKIVAEASAKKVKEVKADKKAKVEETTAETPKDEGDEVELN